MVRGEQEKTIMEIRERPRIQEYLEKDITLSGLRELWSLPSESEWFLVGGAVRDLYFDKRTKIKDYDFVVRNANLEEVTRILEKSGSVDYVGRRFGVLKYTPNDSNQVIDIAWPRTENSGGSGAYRDFSVQSDPELPIEADLSRRDLTVNAMAWDVRKGELIDPYDGIGDLKKKILRTVGNPEERFREDYSRMLRTVRFACRFDFAIEDRTWNAILSLAHHLDDRCGSQKDCGEYIVPREVIAKEFIKALDFNPCRAIDLFEKSGILFRIFPEFFALKDCVQSPENHSEGDVWTHTKLALEKLHSPGFQERFPGEVPTIETILAVLCHDIGKPDTRDEKDGRWTFYGHDQRGGEMIEEMMERVRLSSVGGFLIDKDRISRLVRMHLFPNIVESDTVRRTTLERYFLRDREFGKSLLHLAYADAAASIPKDGKPNHDTLDRLLALLSALVERGREEGKERLLSGSDVMEIADILPGPEVGQLLEEIREAQLRGEISDANDAKKFLRNRISKQ